MKIAVHIGGDDAGRMLARQNLAGARPSLRSVAGGDIGWLPGAMVREHDGNLLVVSGTPIDLPDLSRIRNYRDAMQVLPECNGAFAAVYWDDARRKLVVVTDHLGFKPLYLHRRAGELRLSSDTKAMPGPPDLAGWGAFIALGHTIGDRTLTKDVERVRPASVLVYDRDTDHLGEEQYWCWPQPGRAADTEGLVSALRHSVAEYAKYGDPGTLLLSGGFDSRLILFLLGEAGVPAKATIVSHRDEFFDADGRLAAAIARRAGVSHARVASGREFFSSRAFLDYLAASDAATPSLYLFVSQIAQFVNGGSDGGGAVWEGVVPGYTLTVPHQPPGGFAAYLAQECKGPDADIWRAAALLFREDVYAEMREGFRADLRRELDRYPDDGYGVSEFIVRNRMRNRTSINPYKVYENHARAFTPGMTKAYWDVAGTLSYEARRNNRFYLELLRRYFPAALSVPVLSGNTLVRPSPWSGSYYINRLLAVAARRAAMHPRLARGLAPAGALPFSFGPSRFLDAALLQDPEDPFLAPSADLAAEGPAAGVAKKLLFHWRVWHWLHGGRLSEVLTPLAAPNHGADHEAPRRAAS